MRGLAIGANARALVVAEADTAYNRELLPESVNPVELFVCQTDGMEMRLGRRDPNMGSSRGEKATKALVGILVYIGPRDTELRSREKPSKPTQRFWLEQLYWDERVSRLSWRRQRGSQRQGCGGMQETGDTHLSKDEQRPLGRCP